MHRNNHLGRDEDAISAVVGAILMIAVTVVIGATVYAVVNGFGDDEASSGPNAVFKAQAMDTNNNGLSDRIKISYLTGPAGVPASDVDITVQDEDGDDATPSGTEPSPWNPGDFMVFEDAETYFVTVSILGTTVVDSQLTLEE